MRINSINHIITNYTDLQYFTLKIPISAKILDFIVEDGMFSLIYETNSSVEEDQRDVNIELCKGTPYNLYLTNPYFGKYTCSRAEILPGVDSFRFQNISTVYYAFISKTVAQIREEKINTLLN